MKSRTDYEETIVPEEAGCPQEDRPGTYVTLPLAASLWASLPIPSHSNATSLAPSEEDGEEMLLVIGEKRPLSEYRYLGSHTTDSGLVCLIRKDPYESHGEGKAEQTERSESGASKTTLSDVKGTQVRANNTPIGEGEVSEEGKRVPSPSSTMPTTDLELDWLELVTVSLEGGTIDLDQFPLLKFCAAVPEGESAVAVYGYTPPSATDGGSNVAVGHTNDADQHGYTGLVLRTWTRVFDQQQ